MGESLRMNQAFNYMIQSRASAIPMGRFNRLYGEERIVRREWGQIRLDCISRRLVELVSGNLETGVAYPGITNWDVKDVLTGLEYNLKITEIGGEIYNEMEVIAWAASQ